MLYSYIDCGFINEDFLSRIIIMPDNKEQLAQGQRSLTRESTSTAVTAGQSVFFFFFFIFFFLDVFKVSSLHSQEANPAKLNSSKMLLLSLLLPKMKMIRSKLKVLECPQH